MELEFAVHTASDDAYPFELTAGHPKTIVAVARKIGEPKIILSGECFQNRYLTERALDRLRAEKFLPYWHQRIPPNDGGIALGQVAAATMFKNFQPSGFASRVPIFRS